MGWKLVEVGTKEADGVKVELLGTKLPEEVALKGLIGIVVAEGAAVEAFSIGLEGSLHVETSVEADVYCGEFRSENCDLAAKSLSRSDFAALKSTMLDSEANFYWLQGLL